ncbi:MAG: hypothetical protein EPN79_10760 [Burkholderiaceae bacterium]|nr:MAG: hypothetical protein EPN79_10760 [Burkholderiaceae bacterium]TBR76832.1 MAG: hypothetical protein EPN64_06315 [Burkholderiaceae bacterium]
MNSTVIAILAIIALALGIGVLVGTLAFSGRDIFFGKKKTASGPLAAKTESARSAPELKPARAAKRNRP